MAAARHTVHQIRCAMLRLARVGCQSTIATTARQAMCLQRCAATPSILEPAHDGGVLNKQRIESRTYDYILEHTREPEVLRDLRALTAERFPTAQRMQVPPDQGALLAWLVRTLGVVRAIEVGVFTGYSSTAMALAMPVGSRLVACDRDPGTLRVAQACWERAGVADRVDPRLGPALESLQALLDGGEAGTFDFAFLDADKRGYRAYYELLLQLLRPGGVIAVDNVLFYGRVADPLVEDKATLALRELNDFLVQDARVAVCMVPIGDGLMLCTKRH